jgi:hypothetical protein
LVALECYHIDASVAGHCWRGRCDFFNSLQPHRHPFLERKAALARLLRDTEAGILLNEHIVEDGATVFAHACRLGAEGIVSKRVNGTYRSGPCRAWIKVRNPASIAVQRERSEIWNRRASFSARR